MEWYYMDGERRVGPLGDSEMERRAGSGTVDLATPVWHEGMPDWAEAGQTELSPRIARRSEPTPPPFRNTASASDAQTRTEPRKKGGGIPKWASVLFLALGLILCMCGIVPAGGPMAAFGLWSLLGVGSESDC